jgi:hypothetical protein
MFFKKLNDECAFFLTPVVLTKKFLVPYTWFFHLNFQELEEEKTELFRKDESRNDAKLDRFSTIKSREKSHFASTERVVWPLCSRFNIN